MFRACRSIRRTELAARSTWKTRRIRFDDLRCPPFNGVPCGDGALEDDFLELLFLYVIEFRLASGTFFSCEGVEFAIGFFEFPPPIVDGRSGDFGNVDDVVVVISFEDQLAALKCEGLGR